MYWTRFTLRSKAILVVELTSQSDKIFSIWHWLDFSKTWARLNISSAALKCNKKGVCALVWGAVNSQYISYNHKTTHEHMSCEAAWHRSDAEWGRIWIFSLLYLLSAFVVCRERYNNHSAAQKLCSWSDFWQFSVLLAPWFVCYLRFEIKTFLSVMCSCLYWMKTDPEHTWWLSDMSAVCLFF